MITLPDAGIRGCLEQDELVSGSSQDGSLLKPTPEMLIVDISARLACPCRPGSHRLACSRLAWGARGQVLRESHQGMPHKAGSSFLFPFSQASGPGRCAESASCHSVPLLLCEFRWAAVYLPLAMTPPCRGRKSPRRGCQQQVL